jgi:diguanylate cyclase (GGDEF)-like protein
MTALLAFLAQRSKGFILLVGTLLTLLLALIDFLTGPEFIFFIFYWPPIAMVTWFAGKRWGYAAVAMSGVCWAVAKGAEWLTEKPHVLIWNASVSVASFALLVYLIARLRTLVDLERETARTDFLTGIANARAFAEALEAELARSRRTGAPFSLAYIDLDDFKLINDRFGHETGDQVLAAIAQELRRNFRSLDVVARMGGDEFAILLPDTNQSQAQVALRRVLGRMADVAARHGWPITSSIGSITCLQPARSADELVRRADALMYEVKQSGKNAVRYDVLERPEKDTHGVAPLAGV